MRRRYVSGSEVVVFFFQAVERSKSMVNSISTAAAVAVAAWCGMWNPECGM
jgi:hypothetical protein